MDGLGKKIAIGVTVGVSIIASSAALYMLFREEDDDPTLKEFMRNQSGPSRQYTTKVTIPKDSVGAVIGRGGETIRQIQKESKTTITFDKDDFADENRYAVIKGSRETCAQAQRYIEEIINEQPVIFTEEMTIPHAAVGMVIGRGGETIRYITSVTGAKVNVARLTEPPLNGLNPVTIKGAAEQILNAKNLIDEKVAEHEIRLQNYSVGTRSMPSLKYNNRPLAVEPTRLDYTEDGFEPVIEDLTATCDSGSVEVFVSAVETPDRFWIQLSGPKATQLDKLSDQMTDFYEVEENRTRTTLSSLPIKVGDIVAAPYSLDEHYYRVRILSIDENTYAPEETPVRVFYLDFGDEGTHAKKALCTLKDEFLHFMAFQAIECKLSGVRPKTNEDWSEDAIKYFSEETFAAQWKKLLVKPLTKKRNNNGKGYVWLVDLNSLERHSVAKSLIDRDFAQPADDNLEILSE